jgi:DNA primase small subunit
MYPRLDIEVSKHLNHLLKSPFCVHPGTGSPLNLKHSRFSSIGRICVPIDSSDPYSFDPLTVPTVTALISQIDSWEQTHDTGETSSRISDWEKTSLKDYIQYFKRHVDRIFADQKIIKKEEDVKMGGMATSAQLEF